MRWARPIAMLGAIAAALFLGTQAYRLALADSIVTRANATMESASWTKSTPPLPEWLSVREALLEAQSLAPENAAVHESLGVLHERRSATPTFLIYARDYYREALALRPTSPYTWANVAEVLYLLGQTGPGFEVALQQAAKLGPWEPEVQRLVADVGLAYWSEARPETREIVKRITGFGMRRAPAEILQIAAKRGRLDVACPFAIGNRRVTNEQWSQFCGKGNQT